MKKVKIYLPKKGVLTMDILFEDMKKYVRDDCSPIPNKLIEMPTKGVEAMEFAGFLMVCFSFAWREMIETEGKSEWEVSTRKLKKQKGYTKNKCRKFFLRAMSLKLVTDFKELEDEEMTIKVNPKVYTVEKLEDLN